MNATAFLPDGIKPDHVATTRGLPAGTAASIILSALLLAALLGWLGGTPSERHVVQARQAYLAVSMPRILRSGMFFEIQIEVTAREPLDDAVIAMSPELLRSITINTQIPEPTDQQFKNGLYRLHYGSLGAGERIKLKLDTQINPDLFLGNRGEIAVLDGNRPLGRVPVTLTVLP